MILQQVHHGNLSTSCTRGADGDGRDVELKCANNAGGGHEVVGLAALSSLMMVQFLQGPVVSRWIMTLMVQMLCKGGSYRYAVTLVCTMFGFCC